jgi:two-component system, sensor histidine kinase and response regulator
VDSGKLALEVMSEAQKEDRPYALALLDCHMPDMDGFSVAEQIKSNPELKNVSIIMLTSGGQSSDAARCREVGIAAYLLKPVKQSELLDSILTVLDVHPLSAAPTAVDLPTAQELLPAEIYRPLQILLAEDNKVNQRLASRLLEKKGHTVVPVGNGLEALEALEKGRFDLVLMDVQMPQMSGFEATAAIRAREQRTGARIPIIAMTAHAMTGDRERCLEAGMDDYVSKPIHPQQLFQAIDNAVRVSVELEEKVASASHDAKDAEEPRENQAEAILDTTAVLKRLGGDDELLREIATMFLDEYPRMISAIREAIALGDAESLERAAHAFKGSVGNFCAERASQRALRLEIMGRDSKLAGAEEACARLEEEIGRILPAIASLAEESIACVS